MKRQNGTDTTTKLPIRALIVALVVSIAVGIVALRSQHTEAQTSSNADTLPARPAAGHPAPDFTLLNLDGEEVQLADLRGQPVILNFWASWCGPCRLEMPHLQAASVVHEKDVAVIGVNLTERESRHEDIDAFVDEFGLTFPIVLDEEGDVADLYEVRGQPASVFIGKDGVVDTVFYGAVNEEFIEERIEALLKG